ncbi:unnamed protein product, partial [Didymodactylos carnosus]
DFGHFHEATTQSVQQPPLFVNNLNPTTPKTTQPASNQLLFDPFEPFLSSPSSTNNVSPASIVQPLQPSSTTSPIQNFDFFTSLPLSQPQQAQVPQLFNQTQTPQFNAFQPSTQSPMMSTNSNQFIQRPQGGIITSNNSFDAAFKNNSSLPVQQQELSGKQNTWSDLNDKLDIIGD